MTKTRTTADKVREGLRLLGEGLGEVLEAKLKPETEPKQEPKQEPEPKPEEKAEPRMMIAPGTKCPECGSKLATGEGLVRCSLVSCKLHGAVEQVRETTLEKSLLRGHGMETEKTEEKPARNEPQEAKPKPEAKAEPQEVQETPQDPEALKAACAKAIRDAVAAADRKQAAAVLARFNGAQRLGDLDPADYGAVIEAMNTLASENGEEDEPAF